MVTSSCRRSSNYNCHSIPVGNLNILHFYFRSHRGTRIRDLLRLCTMLVLLTSSIFLFLDKKKAKNQGQNHRPTARRPIRLTFKSGSAFRGMQMLCIRRSQTQAPLRESQAFSPTLGDRCPAFWPWPARPTRWRVGVPDRNHFVYVIPACLQQPCHPCGGPAAMSSLHRHGRWVGIYGCVNFKQNNR